LNIFYPQRSITLTSRDPYYIKAGIKAKLRRKNRQCEQAELKKSHALAERIGKDNLNKTILGYGYGN